ncbi:hypothetical protein QOZ80_7BG0603230 [Eleusine coracana subsp. coracana]|nr:hypothetical protein QOZ80_7BG0603230 [Eleusine coracana subsp. coracana]
MELPELSDLEQQLQMDGIGGDLPSDRQLGLESVIGAGSQVDYYLAHNDAIMAPTFFYADLAELLNDLQQKIDAKATKPTHLRNEIMGCTKRSSLEDNVCMLRVWGGRRRRNCRTRRTSWRLYLLGFQKHFACERGKHTRKNNPHWTEHEVCMLLDGLSEYGVGRWTKIKKAYFGTSIRTAVHLKDKWKNLMEASDSKVRSKKKVKAHKSTEQILRRLEDPIISIADAHAAQERRASRRKQLSL